MLPITYIHGFEAGRAAASGGAVEARKRAAAANYPPIQAVNGLESANSARMSPEAIRRVCVPLRGADAPCRALHFTWNDEINS